MSMLPLGTVTMLFTDIDGSTRLLQHLGDEYAPALTRQRSIIRAAIAKHRGHEMGTEGDSFFVVFDRARDAVLAGLDAQRGLQSADWPAEGQAWVRMGVHSGEPLPHEGGYVGLDVHRAARIAGAAHGGQLVVSEATRSLVDGSLPEGVHLRSLGAVRLKDLPRPEHLFQLTAKGLRSDFPPLRSLGAITALPTFATRLIGRTEELTRLTALLDAQNTLITLVGPGGAGKTRVAVAAAARSAERGDRSVFFVDLHTATIASAALWLIADAVGASDASGSPATDHAVLTAITAGPALLVLDNVEQISDVEALVAALLDDAPQLVLLLTSRRPVHLRAEHVVDVGPLSVADASALFADLAQRARHDFRLDARNERQVAEICSSVDRLPLAIELAAARSRVLSPAALLSRLDLSLGRAPSDAVDRPTRQRTLRSTVAWSVDLLPADARTTLYACAVFEGGCRLEDYANVLDVNVGEALDRAEVLADCNLLTFADSHDDEPRLTMLTTVRDYAAERLRGNAHENLFRQRHAAAYADLAETAGSLLRGPSQAVSTATLRREEANIRAALSWCLDESASASDPAGTAAEDRLALGLRIANAMMWFWYRTGRAREGRQLLERLGGTLDDDAADSLVLAIQGLAVLQLQIGDAANGIRLLERVLSLWQTRDNRPQICRALNSLGVAHRDLGHTQAARACFTDSIAIAQELSEHSRRAVAMSNLAQVALDERRPQEASDLLEQVLERDRAAGDHWAVVIGESNLTAALVDLGRLDAAVDVIRHAASLVAEMDDLESAADVLERGASVRCGQGEWAAAARLLGTAAHIRTQVQTPMSRVDARWLADTTAPGIKALGETDWTTAFEEGAATTIQEALATLRAAP